MRKVDQRKAAGKPRRKIVTSRAGDGMVEPGASPGGTSVGLDLLKGGQLKKERRKKERP